MIPLDPKLILVILGGVVLRLRVASAKQGLRSDVSECYRYVRFFEPLRQKDTTRHKEFQTGYTDIPISELKN
jgi:hypothetical protein